MASIARDAMIVRVVASVTRWQSLEALLRTYPDRSSDAEDAASTVQKLQAAVSVLKSIRFRDVVTDAYLIEISKLPTVEIVDRIAAQLGKDFPRKGIR